MCGGVAAQVMRSQFDPDQLPRLIDHRSGCLIANWEYSLLRPYPVLLHILLQPVGHFLGDENEFPSITALRFSEGQLPVIYIFRGEFENFPDPHAAPGHELQHEPVPQFGCFEDDLIHRVLLDGVPANRWPVPEELFHHEGIAGIPDVLVEVVPDEVEKSGELRVSDALCLRLCSVGYSPKEGQDLLRGEGLKVSLPEFVPEP